MSYLNSDAYDKGYAKGLADATHQPRPKKKNNLPLEAGLKSIVQINANYYQETYTKGYDTGYADGLAKRNNVYTSNNTTMENNTSSNTNSIQRQIELLKQMNHTLGSINISLRTISRNYRIKGDELIDRSFFTEYAKRYTNELIPNYTQITKKVTHKIQDEDREYIKTIIAQLEERK